MSSGCCSRLTAELLGLLKLPLVLLFVLAGRLLRLLISSLLRPFSDYLLKATVRMSHS